MTISHPRSAFVRAHIQHSQSDLLENGCTLKATYTTGVARCCPYMDLELSDRLSYADVDFHSFVFCASTRSQCLVCQPAHCSLNRADARMLKELSRLAGNFLSAR